MLLHPYNEIFVPYSHINKKQSKFTEHEYHKHRPRKVLFSEHVYFVQICPVFAGPVTYNIMQHIANYINRQRLPLINIEKNCKCTLCTEL